MASALDQLYSLAEQYGIHTNYYDVTGRLIHAGPEALTQVLRSLGANLEKVEDAPAATRARQQALWRRRLEPVHVLWDGAGTEINLRLPQQDAGGSLLVRLHLESGEMREWSLPAESLPFDHEAEIEGVRYIGKRLTIPGTLPLGYHCLVVEQGQHVAESLLLAAPARAYESAPSANKKAWGVFLPLYALHSERSWGAGDFSDLEALTDWVTELGGGMVATLPLLAAFLDEPFEPGPYSPASRLFWNEFYIDVTRVPELASCPSAQRLLNSATFQQEIQELRAQGLVDYHRQMALKRQVLEELARAFFGQPSERRNLFASFLESRPEIEDYARFRAVGEARKEAWLAWPERLRHGHILPEDFGAQARDYHQYVQWLAHEQLQRLAAKARAAGPGLYLDLPVGVNPDSYDAWREREAFATGMATGAPPDPFFAKGQNWGFAPLHPERIREQGYRYVRAYLRHHLSLAGVLRIDHMMGFHRLFWVPHGSGAADGIYVRYPADELYAVFSLESHRHRSVLVGEDLGTVPEGVRPTMEAHNLHRMYVMQYELQPQYHNALTPVYSGCVASLNTHDMPPFKAFLEGRDIQDRLDLGILDAGVGEHERRSRQGLIEALIRSLRVEGLLGESTEPLALLRASLLHLGIGSGRVALASLEDLWLETQPQNMPGTWREQPNWRRRARYSLEQIKQLPAVLSILRELDQVVKRAV
jgi:4-alpha-glucanotransferase